MSSPERTSALRQVVTIALLPLLVGCGTIQRGPLQRVHVETEPPGATVTTERCGIRTDPPAITPAVIWISRRAKECTIHIVKEGYVPAATRLARRVDLEYELLGGGEPFDSLTDFIAMLFFWTAGFVVSSVVDTATGAVFVVEPSQLWLTLEEAPETPAEEAEKAVSPTGPTP